MARLTTVEFWPATGFPDRPWLDEPSEDAWVKSARRVCELYSEALSEHQLANNVSSLRMFVHSATGGDSSPIPAVVVTPRLEPVWEGFEMAPMTIPREVADLTPIVRARLVLDAVGLAMRSLAVVRGWPLTVVDDVGQAVLDRGLHFDWVGRAVQERRRRYRARTRFRLADDGCGRVRVELHDVRTGDLVGLGPELLAYSTIEGFRRTSKSLRWQDSKTIVVGAFRDAFGFADAETTLRVPADFVRPPALRPQALPRDLAPAGEPVRIEVALAAPPKPAITGGGGGPMNDVPPLYAATVDWLFEHIPDDITAWWRTTGLTTLHVTYHYWGNRVSTRLVRRGEDIEASVRRPMPDAGATSDPIGAAHHDLNDVLLSVQRRFRLGPPPTLPLPAEAELEQHVRDWSESPEEDPFDLELMRALLPPELFSVFEAQQDQDDD